MLYGFLILVIIGLGYLLKNEMNVNLRKSEEIRNLRDQNSKTSILCHRQGMTITLYESGFTPEMVKAHFEELDRRMAKDK